MSKDLLLKIYQKAKEKQIIDEEFLTFLESVFPDKSATVIEVIKRGITKYVYTPSNRIVWTAKGENQEHMIYPQLYCSCQDFYKNIVIKRKRDFCKHILAQIISEALKSYKLEKVKDQHFNKLIRDFKLKI
ncbi:MAG: SWIM zinc finger family protein [Candidatus Lokiarchaeota archaeon]|nr:SWIM zinc finger family protein [Candidatus Lokiarchaeota archaeon]